MNKIIQSKIFLIKKDIIICFILFSMIGVLSVHPMTVSATSLSKASIETMMQQNRVTLKISNQPIKTILAEIYKQTKINFIFKNEKEISSLSSMSITVSNVTVKEALDKLFTNTDFTYKIEDNVVTIVKKDTQIPKVNVQKTNEVLLIGKVIEKTTKKPIVGATVIVVDKPMGAITDDNGAFSFLADANDVLEVSCIGKKAIKYDKKLVSNTAMVFEMEDDAMDIEEVVVNGYYARKKESLTGSAVVISGKELGKVSSQNLIGALQVFDPSFRVTENLDMGSNPNALPDFRIRGNSGLGTITEGNLKGSPNLPTFILDGYEVKVEKIYDLDLDRVESVTILKDASATAIYGSRAANGVVVVATKAPLPGKLRVSYNFTGTIQAPDLSDYNLLNAKDKLRAEVLAGRYDATNSSPDFEQNSRMDYAERERAVREGVDTYWLSKPLHSAFGHKHSLYIDGGDEAVRYAIDVNYQGNPGVMKESKRDRFGAGFQLSYNYKNKLLFKNYITVSKVKSNESSYGNFSEYAKMNPYYRTHDENGNLNGEYKSNVVTSYRIYNPLHQSTLNNIEKSNYFEWTNNFDFDWKIIDALRLKARVAYTEKYDTYYKFKSPRSLEYQKYDYAENEGVMKRGAAESSNTKSNGWDSNITLSFNKYFGKHSLNAVVGGNFKEDVYEMESYKVYGFANEILDRPSYANYFDGISPDGDEGKTRLAGFLANLNYSYADKYLFDASFRLDGSSMYGYEKRSAPFWSLGLGWNIHKEKFFGKGEILNQLKVTANVGTTGKASFAPYEAQTSFSYNREQWYGTSIGATLMAMGNPNLEWEKTYQYDLRLEAGFLQDLVTLSVNYYLKDTKDLLSDITLPLSTGFKMYRENIGSLKNEGFEVNLKAYVVRNKDLNINVYGSLVNNKNTIKSISNSLKSYNEGIDNDMNEQEDGEFVNGTKTKVKFMEGQSTTAIYAVRSHGINPANGRELYINKDGSLTYLWDATQQVVCGDTEPTISGTLGANIDYKGFNLNFNFLYEMGGDIYNQTLVDRVENADAVDNVDRRVLEDRWNQTGDIAKFKNIGDKSLTTVTSRFVEKNNLLRLQSLSLSYTLDRDMTKNWGIERLKVGFLMNDVFRIATVKQERGLSYPFARSFNLNLQIQF